MGGCDPVGGENDHETRFVEDAFKSMHWKTDRVYGNNFTMDRMQSALDPSRYSNGEQLFISIRTHGGEGPPHQICMQDPATGKQTWVDVTALKPLLDRLVHDKHVKIALADGSCYGGGSIAALAGPGICVASSTYDNYPSYRTSVGASIAARVAASKLPAAQAQALFARHSDPQFSLSNARTPDAELDGRSGLSMEEAFLTSRAFRGYTVSPHYHRPAQISSDVEGAGSALGEEFPLALQFNTDDASAARVQQAFSRDLFSTGLACDPSNPFQSLTALTAGMGDVRDRQACEDTAQRLGFASVADAQDQMRTYYRTRRDNYQHWKHASDRLNAVRSTLADPDNASFKLWVDAKQKKDDAEQKLRHCTEDQGTPGFVCTSGSSEPLKDQIAELRQQISTYTRQMNNHQEEMDQDPRLRQLQADYTAAQAEYQGALNRDASLSGSDLYMRLEKVYYQVRYLQQRERTRDTEKAKACSQFVF